MPRAKADVGFPKAMALDARTPVRAYLWVITSPS
jgi:hypothetical protein